VINSQDIYFLLVQISNFQRPVKEYKIPINQSIESLISNQNLFPVSIKSSLFRVINLTEANWADVESELLSSVTSIQGGDVLDWHSGGGFGVNLHNGFVPAG
jgi:hypothetical protein